MRKFKVVCDPETHSFGSTDIIVKATNKAAKKLGLYSEADATVVYDCLGKHWGHNPDAIWCAYELVTPELVMNNLAGKMVVGLSKDNAWMFQIAGYQGKIEYCSLGVDREIWKPVEKTYLKDKLVYFTAIESTVRACLPELIECFGETYSGDKDKVLFIKDRIPEPKFVEYVLKAAKYYNVEIIHDTRHIEDFEETRRLFAHADCHIYLNRAGTWCMTATESMSCGLPFAGLRFSGPTDYLSHLLNGYAVEYDLVPATDNDFAALQNIGMKNFLFSNRFHKVPPFWAKPRKESIVNMLKFFENENNRVRLRKAGYLTADWFSWERTATNMSFILSNL